MGLQLLYPEGKKKAVTFSYDDGQIHDRRLVKIFNRYGLKATFHLNSGTLGKEGYIGKEESKDLYEGHEVACHGVRHEYLNFLGKERLMRELWEDRKNLESIMDRIVLGMSYAFGEYGEAAIETLRAIGLQYARTVESTHAFRIPTDFMRWAPTCHHNQDVGKKLEEFKNTPGYSKLPLFYIWGHSYELEREGTWDGFEDFCKEISGLPDVWYGTNLEICRYIKAVRGLVFNTDETKVYNPSGVTAWLLSGKKELLIKPGETVSLTV